MDVKGYEGLYKVNKSGVVFSIRRGIILKQRPTRKGYRAVTISKNARPITMEVHRVVAIAWLDNPNNKPQVHHKNNIRFDNRVINLKWVYSHENNRYKYRKMKKRKIKKTELDKMYRLYCTTRLGDVAKAFNLPSSVVRILLFYIHPSF